MQLRREKPGLGGEWCERGNLAVLEAYWQSKCTTLGRLPARRDIDPGDLIPILPWVLLLDVLPGDDGSHRFRYRLAGSAHYDKNGREITGQLIEEAFPDPEVAARLIADGETCVHSRQPVYRKTRIGLPDRGYLVYERIVCPLVDDSGAVSMLLGVVDYLEQGRED